MRCTTATRMLRWWGQLRRRMHFFREKWMRHTSSMSGMPAVLSALYDTSSLTSEKSSFTLIASVARTLSPILRRTVICIHMIQFCIRSTSILNGSKSE